MKVDRKKIWMMFNKKCAYCGCDLLTETGKHMQIDHIEPIRRNWWNGTAKRPERDVEINMFPSCPKCNNYKHSLSVESFRRELKLSLQHLTKYAAYNNALRYGLVEEKQWDGLFYFEKHQRNTLTA